MREVFISYKSKKNAPSSIDEKVANDLCHKLEAAGITCWIASRDIEAGVRSYEGVIMRAIKECKVMLLVFSKFTNDSDDVFKEVANAARHKQQIIPFKIDDAEPNDRFEYHLGSVHWIDATGDYRQKIPALIADLQSKLGKPESVQFLSPAVGDSIITVAPQPDSAEAKTEIEKLPLVKEPILGKDNKTDEKVTHGDNDIISIKMFRAKGVSFKMVCVEGGTFTMGATSEQGDDAGYNEKPNHQVTLSRYYIGETLVTQELWQAVMGHNPSVFKGNMQRPVENISWKDCQVFITKLNEEMKGGIKFRLPTEAEWEFAARGGNMSKGYKYAGSNNLDEVAWYADNTIISTTRKYFIYNKHTRSTFPVAIKKPNELGLYDMCGNVWEWCQDWYGKYNEAPQEKPMGPSSGPCRVFRGGGWVSSAKNCRVTYRNNMNLDSHWLNCGLRLALDL